ncbi:MAG: class I SAM-dependent methyltransferase [Promethearchaeota archaeon]|jgi:methyltransferase (TIGR00027 family)
MDFPLVRSTFIEENLLTPWCNTYTHSQIVFLGTGLDTRGYRFKPFQNNNHIIYEIDFPIVIDYKEKLMQEKKPLCKIIRLSADLIDPDWSSHLIKNGFSNEIPTFWVLEGLVYYIERESVSSLLTKMAEVCKVGSQIFVDIIGTSRGKPFSSSENETSTVNLSKHQEWILNLEEVPSFFTSTGWDVKSSLVDEHFQDRDVEQKGMVFIHGIKV